MVELPTYKELENKIATLEAELDALQEKEVRKERHRVLGRVAHEFNNLMMVVQGNISIMLHDSTPTYPGYERLQHMERYIKSGTRLTEKLLDYVAMHDDDQRHELGLFLENGRSQNQRTKSGIDIYRKASQGKTRVLLVDDEELILDVGAQMLAKIAIEVITAPNGVMAVELFKEDPDSIDLVILDLIMPGIDGIDTFHLLREINPEIKVLISSGYRKDERIENFLNEKQTGFIKKPFSLSRLAEEVRSLLSY